jgi:nitrogen fixation protein FixH
MVVESSYVAGQEFNARAAEGRAQAALGWKSTLTVADGRIGYALADRDGKPVALTGGTAAFRHPAYAAEDITQPLSPQQDGTLGAERTIRDGVWIVEVRADAGLDHPYRDIRRLMIRKGAIE